MAEPQKKEKTLLDDPFLRLEAPCPVAGQENRKSSLRQQMGKAGPQSLMNPHIVVYTNDPNEKDRDTNYGKIIAKFTFFEYAAFWESFADLVAGPNNEKIFVDCKDFIFAGGKRSDTPMVTARVTAAKTEEGVITISVTAKNRPNIVFEFMPRNFHDFRMGDGSMVPRGLLSQRYARGYYKSMVPTMQKLLAEKYIEPEPMPVGGWGNRQGGGGGGGQGGGNNWGNNNNRGGSSGGGGGGWGGDGDGDIPF